MKKITYIFLAALVGTAAVTNAQTLDYTFNAGIVYCPRGNGIASVSPITLQADGKILIGGNFTSINGVARNYIARLNQDGTVDDTFDPGVGTNWFVSAIVLQPDGKILIGGFFSSYNQTNRNYIARINPDGSIDTTFNPGTGADSYIDDVALQPDGKILIGGRFTSYNGTSRNYIARLNSDGTIDTKFNHGEGGDGTDRYVFSIALQTDGKIIIGGAFATYNGISRRALARLNPDGSLDNDFNPGLVGNDVIRKVLIQSDGKILVGGGISYHDTVSHCMRFNRDGSVDTTFVRGKVEGGTLAARPAAIQQDGKIFMGGWFSSYNGTPRNGIVRLNRDGSVDTTFDPGKGAEDYNSVGSIILQPDGRILIGGSFTSYNGVKIDNMARLMNNYSSKVSDMDPVEQPLAALFPVPTREKFFITTGEHTADRIDVMTVLGQVIARVEPTSPQTEISLADQPTGLYFVTVRMGTNSRTFKLVKGE